ncbi:hypothetical protein IMSHALPRED_000925 [Imshaugia aleurites]|uniref:Uncharacterized protein n=1 Tax=Imshaugia aleurites TaxID=172621 RepID=A0A8H3EWM8_9LECA|nr:hypothetical protein IMSHALPRED_000925 [Imshaugia aleurites]
MPPLDLLDSVTAGHMTNASPSPSPERGPATNRHDGPPDTPLPAYERQDDAPIANDYPAPPPSPPAYRLIPHRPFFFHNNGRRACVRWLRLVYLDILLLLTVVASVKVMMVFSDNVYRWDERYFPMTWDPDSKKWYGPPELSYPHSPLIFSVVFLAVLLPAVGAAVVIGMQLWVRSFWDANAGLFGLFKGLVLM